MKSRLNAHLLALLATFLIAGSFIVSGKLSGVIDSISLTLFRFVFAALLLAPVILFKQKYRVKIILTFNRAMTISFFYALYFIGLFTSLEYTTALNTGTLFTLMPLLTALFSIFVFKQKISLTQLLAYLVGIVGTCIVIFKGDLEQFYMLSLNKGDIIFLFSLISMALYSISAKYLYKKDDELIVVVFMTLVGGSIWMGLALGILDIPLEWYKIKNELFLYMMYLSIGATFFTVYLNQKATVILGPKKVMSYIYLSPAVIALIVSIFGHNSISFKVFIGILISSCATIFLLTKE